MTAAGKLQPFITWENAHLESMLKRLQNTRSSRFDFNNQTITKPAPEYKPNYGLVRLRSQ